MLTDELIKNIADRYGKCGQDWYITEDSGKRLYLFIVTNGKGSLPILMHDTIMRHMGLLPKTQPQEPQPQCPPVPLADSTPDTPTRDEMLLQITGYYNTRKTASERTSFLRHCHYPTSSVEELHDEDITTLYNILKLKGYTQQWNI